MKKETSPRPHSSNTLSSRTHLKAKAVSMSNFNKWKLVVLVGVSVMLVGLAVLVGVSVLLVGLVVLVGVSVLLVGLAVLVGVSVMLVGW